MDRKSNIIINMANRYFEEVKVSEKEITRCVKHLARLFGYQEVSEDTTTGIIDHLVATLL